MKSNEAEWSGNWIKWNRSKWNYRMQSIKWWNELRNELNWIGMNEGEWKWMTMNEMNENEWQWMKMNGMTAMNEMNEISENA